MEFKWKENTLSGDGNTESGKGVEATTITYLSTSDMYGQICLLVNLLNRISYEKEGITYNFEIGRFGISLVRFIFEPNHIDVKEREELIIQYYPYKLTEAEERKLVKNILLKLTEIVTEMGGDKCGD